MQGLGPRIRWKEGQIKAKSEGIAKAGRGQDGRRDRR